jgi:hypothetical protein
VWYGDSPMLKAPSKVYQTPRTLDFTKTNMPFRRLSEFCTRRITFLPQMKHRLL